jgi:hypothetical protein
VKIDFNAYIGISSLAKKLDLLDASEWVHMMQMAWDNDGKERPLFLKIIIWYQNTILIARCYLSIR